MANRNFIYPVKRKKTKEEKYALFPPPKEEVKEWMGLFLTDIVIIALFILIPIGVGPLTQPKITPQPEDTLKVEVNVVYVEPKKIPVPPKPKPKPSETEPLSDQPTMPTIPSTTEEWKPAKPKPAPEETYAAVPNIPGGGEWEPMVPSLGTNPSPFRPISPNFRIPKNPGGREPGPGTGGTERKPVTVTVGASGEITIGEGIKDERIYWAFRQIIPRLRDLKARNITGTIGDNSQVGEDNLKVSCSGKFHTIKVDYKENPIITLQYDFSTNALEELTKIFLADFEKQYPDRF